MIHKDSFLYQTFHTLFIKGFLLVNGLLVSVLTARLLGPSKRGLLTLFLSLIAILTPFLNLGIKQSVAYLVGQKRFSEKDIYSNVILVFLLTAVVGSVSLIIGYYKIGLISKYGILLTLTFVGYFVLQLFKEYSYGFLLGRKNIEKMNINEMLVNFTLTMFLFIFLYLCKFGVQGAATAYFFSSAIIIPITIIQLRLFELPHYRFEIVEKLLSKGILFALSLFVLQLNYRIDVLLLGKLRNEYSVGIYSVGVNIAELIKQISLSTGIVLFSHTTNWREEFIQEALNKVCKITRVLFILIFISAIIVFAFSRQLVITLYGKEFDGSIGVIRWLLPGVIMITIFQILNFFSAGQGKPHIPLFTFLPALVLNIGLNLFMIPKFDYIGAAISSTISYSFATILYIFVFKHLYKIKIKNLFLPNRGDIEHLINVLKKKKE